VKDLLAFVNYFQTAKEAFIKASSAAATAVKENMEKDYVKVTRILLDIEFQGPCIIIPQRSDSADALIIDLSYFTLKNRFDLRKIRNEIGSPAIMDSISLNLLELRVVLAVVDGMKGKSEKKLIEPLSFSLDLIRNLSSTWYSEEPELRVDLDLGKLSIFLSDFAYLKLMKVVSDNLEEGQLTDNKLTEEATDKIKRRESSRPICAIEEKPIYLPTSLSSELSKENPLLSSQSSELPEDRIPVAPQTPVIADFASESLDPIVIRPTVRQYLPHPSPPSPPSPCCCGFCSCCVFL
jgi:vacuolar protein sorting-associated protein 13A/C